MLRTFVCAVAALVLCVGVMLADEIKGKIKSVDQDKMTVTVTDEDGKEHVLIVDKESKFVTAKGDLKDGFKSKRLKEGAKVTVKCEKKDGKEVCTEIKLEGGKKQ